MKKYLGFFKPLGGLGLSYIAFFILNEIVISGGKYEGDAYTIALNIVIIAIVLWIFRERYYHKPVISRFLEGLFYAVTFAVLDYLLVNLLLYNNNLSIYKVYYHYVYYGILLVIPIIANYIIPVAIKLAAIISRKAPLDKPESNHIIR